MSMSCCDRTRARLITLHTIISLRCVHVRYAFFGQQAPKQDRSFPFHYQAWGRAFGRQKGNYICCQAWYDLKPGPFPNICSTIAITNTSIKCQYSESKSEKGRKQLTAQSCQCRLAPCCPLNHHKCPLPRSWPSSLASACHTLPLQPLTKRWPPRLWPGPRSSKQAAARPAG